MARAKTLTKTEEFNGEEQSEIESYSDNFKMGYADKLVSMTNAVKILPPNLIKDGRHTKENIQALCGFVVTDKMMNEIYASYSHEPY